VQHNNLLIYIALLTAPLLIGCTGKLSPAELKQYQAFDLPYIAPKNNFIVFQSDYKGLDGLRAKSLRSGSLEQQPIKKDKKSLEEFVSYNEKTKLDNSPVSYNENFKLRIVIDNWNGDIKSFANSPQIDAIKKFGIDVEFSDKPLNADNNNANLFVGLKCGDKEGGCKTDTEWDQCTLLSSYGYSIYPLMNNMKYSAICKIKSIALNTQNPAFEENDEWSNVTHEKVKATPDLFVYNIEDTLSSTLSYYMIAPDVIGENNAICVVWLPYNIKDNMKTENISKAMGSCALKALFTRLPYLVKSGTIPYIKDKNDKPFNINSDEILSLIHSNGYYINKNKESNP
jgi:hypothetical protein